MLELNVIGGCDVIVVRVAFGDYDVIVIRVILVTVMSL